MSLPIGAFIFIAICLLPPGVLLLPTETCVLSGSHTSVETPFSYDFSLGVSDLSQICNGVFQAESLSRLIAPFAGSSVRVAVAVDSLYYNMSTTAWSPLVLSSSCFLDIVGMTEKNGLELVFSLNAEGIEGSWSSANARSLLSFAEGLSHKITWEFGNEPGLWRNKVSPGEYATRLCQTFHGFNVSRIAIPDISGGDELSWTWATEALNSIGLTCPSVAQQFALTWHHYPLAISSAVSPLQVLSPYTLGRVDMPLSKAQGIAQKFDFVSEVWIGETGSVNLGGKAGISDRFVSAFWYVDQLVRAVTSQQRMFRQVLYGAQPYALLEQVGCSRLRESTCFAPRPDYYVSLLMSTLIGDRWFPISGTCNASALVGMFAFASKNNTFGILVWNTMDKEAMVSLESSAHCKCARSSRRMMYALGGAASFQRNGDVLSSSSVYLNGDKLTLSPDGYPPVLHGKKGAASSNVLSPPYSIILVEFADCPAS